MRSKLKKLLVGCLAIPVVFSISFVGCGNQTSKETSKTDSSTNDKVKPITITVFSGATGSQPTENNKIFNLIKEKLGVTFKFEFLVGDIQQKAGVMVAGGDYPDLIGASSIQTFVDAGALIPLEDLIKKNDNLNNHYGPIINKIKDQKSQHVYIMPNYGVYSGTLFQSESWGSAFWIQKAVLKEFGYPKIKTLDEYFDLIKKYKEKYPTIDGKPTVGFEILTDRSRDWALRNAPEHLSGHPNDGNVVVDNNVAQIFADKDISKKYYKKLNEVFKLDLIDKEAFVMNYDQYIAKLSSGRVLGLFDQRWNFENANTALLDQKKDERTYAPIALTYDSSIKDRYMDIPSPNINCGYGISTKCKDPERIMSIFNELLNEDWQKLIQWGIKDEDYIVKDGKFARTQKQRDEQNNPQWKLANRVEALLAFIPKLEGSYSDGNATSAGSQPGEYYDSLKPIDKELLDAYGVKTYGQLFSTPPENPVYYPCFSIQMADNSPEKVTEQKMRDLAIQYLPKLIMDKSDQFDSLWDEYVAQIRKTNVSGYEKFINDGIKDRIKNWSK